MAREGNDDIKEFANNDFDNLDQANLLKRRGYVHSACTKNILLFKSQFLFGFSQLFCPYEASHWLNERPNSNNTV
ncbi:hypothetical protein CHUAL_001577 [Chamberlinius hualienensis]